MTDLLDNNTTDFCDSHVESSTLPSVEELRWPLCYGLITSWVLPATTARRLLHIGLLKAFAFHVAAGLIYFFVAMSILGYLIHSDPWGMWREMGQVIAARPADYFIPLAIIIGILEGMYLVAALLLAAWAASDEKVRSSLRHALRVVWLQSMHVVVASLLWLSIVALWVQYLVALHFDSELRWSERPWYQRHQEEIWNGMLIALGTWAFWAMLRAAGARAVRKPIGAPPICQVCGYNLIAAPIDGNCPECGESVVASIGPDARCGVLWEQRGGVRWPNAWLQTAWRAMREPTRFGRDLQLYSPPEPHRRFLLAAMAVSIIPGIMCAMAWYLGYLSGHGSYQSMGDDFVWLTLPMSGLWAGFAPLIFSLAFAGLLGVISSFGAGRNTMSAAMRCAAYLSGFVVVGLAANIPLAWMYGIAPGVDLFEILGAMLKMDDESIAILIWTTANLPWLGIYVLLLQRMLKSARYADR